MAGDSEADERRYGAMDRIEEFADMDTEEVDRQIVDNANALARSFYKSMGCEVPDGYRFDKARHPQERLCWTMACDAFDMIEGTDPNEALASLED